MSIWQSVLLITVAALVVFATRALPFVIFKGNAVLPSWLSFLGKVLPGAVIAVLVIYCLRTIDFDTTAGWLPAIIGVAVVAGLHIWRRNNLISIGGGTIIYMLLVQLVF